MAQQRNMDDSILFDPEECKEYELDVTLGLSHPNVAVRWLGREVVVRDQPRIEHRGSPVAFIKYCVQGRGVFQYGSKRQMVKPGMVFWSESEAHSILDLRGDEPLVNYVVTLLGRKTKYLFDEYLHSQAGIASLMNPGQVCRIMEDLVMEGLSASDHRQDNCRDLAMILLRRIDSQMVSPLKSKKRARNTFWGCKQFIEEHFERINDLSDVADACTVSIPYLCRLFDEFNKMSAYQYLSKLKLSKASRLLTTTQLSVTEISRSLGFKDLQRFCRNFKIAYGKSPTRYRKDHS